ncbi:hypothetical protein J5N97_020777 [Dioscorea zingiberensis]|uniref:Cyclic nucleotide-binding domain-containing protein n=1 Tax=Dioscorea zingiberensis TaxID=325984 RepID=A0A9D5CHW3_9LILI|nr:hypothetical protein J5N97_020777 [Dioscorea zingiberensis]
MGYCPNAWNGFSWGAFRELGAFTRLSIASGIMMWPIAKSKDKYSCHVNLVMKLNEEFFLPGEVIIEQGSAVDQIYILSWTIGQQEEEVVIGEDESKLSSFITSSTTTAAEVSNDLQQHKMEPGTS